MIQIHNVEMGEDRGKKFYIKKYYYLPKSQ